MNFLITLWNYLNLTAPYLLLGIILSGIIHTFIPLDWILKHLGKKSLSSVFKASMVGVPLPLCSCSVIPTAVTLSKKGATNAATSAFLISTPETGVDSIIMTYAMMDLPMTIIRPISAFVTAMAAGFLNYFFNKEINKFTALKEDKKCCDHDHEHPHQDNHVQTFLNFIYHDLINDLAKWVLLGIFLGAVIDFYVPIGILEHLNGFGGKILMILIGIPLYICASSTTPIAASLIMKGMSPGTALILLLAGPATNISTLVVMQNYIGKKGIFLNAMAIALSSLLISFIVDFLYNFYSWPLNFKILETNEHNHFGLWNNLISVFLLLLLIKGLVANYRERKHS